mmetsp:Transcript_20314/g.41412  ORF Transcript_20314/g.41412 Transcript_20314/m.41412 type:complete len:201 (+) Transcript_20314:105-707(+)
MQAVKQKKEPRPLLAARSQSPSLKWRTWKSGVFATWRWHGHHCAAATTVMPNGRSIQERECATASSRTSTEAIRFSRSRLKLHLLGTNRALGRRKVPSIARLGLMPSSKKTTENGASSGGGRRWADTRTPKPGRRSRRSFPMRGPKLPGTMSARPGLPAVKVFLSRCWIPSMVLEMDLVLWTVSTSWVAVRHGLRTSIES